LHLASRPVHASVQLLTALVKSYTANAYEVLLIPQGTIAERAAFLEKQWGGQ